VAHVFEAPVARATEPASSGDGLEIPSFLKSNR
jgi:hypothetical protein